MRIEAARFPDEAPIVRQLFGEYTAALGVDLTFQAVDAELASLPGAYASPAGTVLLAYDDGREPIGCAALRPRSEAGIAEMKRLYVRPAARGRDLGRLLAVAIVDHARRAGYERVVLDTLPTMLAAQQLYASLGFRPTEAYYDNPIVGTRYLALDLR